MEELTEVEKEAVLFYLGYPTKVLRDNSTHFNRILNNRMDNLSSFAIDRIRELLGLIQIARKNLDQTQTDAHVSQIDNISLDTEMAVRNVRKQYDRYLKELSATLDIPMRSKPYASVGSVKVVW